ncbi:MAG: S-methyl-5-thioribose-1-phosphate isomerase [Fidelibacterota bacterium]|nr:MAG: S-methyl-5-thioribose-1-phosphate isomerase [Candidatus Neomarinimicrobiota bacterium]
MLINGKTYRTVWMADGLIHAINQLLIPAEFEIITFHDTSEVVDAIRTMVVRGAPAIGALGAYGLAQALQQLPRLDMDAIHRIKSQLQQTRPTAHDLAHGLKYVLDHIGPARTLEEMKALAVEAAETYAESSAKACKQIGAHGNALIEDGARILTHCNAGALATVDFGTALAAVRMAHYDGKSIFVYVDETRPRLQGSKITAWELAQEGIAHAIIADSAAGHYMRSGDIDIVITGADRIAANGDAANKIGTYEKAVLAGENNIPFYIAAPLSTIDFQIRSGGDIPIEERDESEILYIDGQRIASPTSPAMNPAFDVTPAKYIRGIITEQGIFKPEDIKTLADRHA